MVDVIVTIIRLEIIVIEMKDKRIGDISNNSIATRADNAFTGRPILELIKITESNLQKYKSRIIKITESQLGHGYISDHDLENRSNAIHVAINDATQVVGYTITKLFENKEFFKCHPKIRPDRFSRKAKLIGYIDTIAVSKAEQGKGIGYGLMNFSLNFLTHESPDLIAMVGWDNGRNINIDGLARLHQFKRQCVIENFWQDFIGHCCPTCKVPPCQCAGVLYYYFP